MALCGTDQDKQRLVSRLKRIEGQVRGLCAMIENDRDCMEVLRQVTSASGALRGVWLQITGDHIRGCLQNASLDMTNRDKLIDELMEHLGKIR
ncbi:MAG: metal-sensitive transcriptional regulator [Spirochaetales bacterium]|jgi:DNA-binding FrmR family transcriptional regulator|nr:metal-sensitive transcriptional regulator [Spirochaetales bacterium]